MKNVELGKLGEDYATQYLLKKEYKILDKNFYIKGGEIDIVAKKDESIIFVEVKTRADENWQPIEESITERKLKFIENAAEVWFLEKNYPETFWQIDFIGIILDRRNIPSKIVHLEDM